MSMHSPLTNKLESVRASDCHLPHSEPARFNTQRQNVRRVLGLRFRECYCKCWRHGSGEGVYPMYSVREAAKDK
jgi:hypothetical protein